MRWYEQPMRIAALQCNYEDGRNLEVVDRWEEAGFNVEQLFHPMADAYSALFDEARHGEVLRRYLRRAREAGIRIILYANVHILGPSHAQMHEQWAQRASDGTYPLLYDTYYACCFNSKWRQHFLGVLDSLAGYSIDGIFLDGPVVVAGGCHCPSCRMLFASRFGAELDGASDADRFAFYRDTKDEFLRQAYARFRDGKPRGVFYINLPVTSPHASYVSIPAALEYNDIVGSEGGFMFYGPAKGAPLWKPSLRAKILEAVAPKKPRVVFMAADHKPWSWYPHTPVETRLCIASSVANGANIWYGLHGSTRLLRTPGCRAGMEMIRFLARHQACYEGSRSAADIALLYSYDTERELGAVAERSDFYGSDRRRGGTAGNHAQAVSGACDALSRSSIPFDVVTDLDLSAAALRRYRLLILPSCACLSDSALDAVRAYVRRGGALLATGDSSLYTDRGERRQDLGLADVLGVRFTGEVTGYRDHNYLSPERDEDGSADWLFRSTEIPHVPSPPQGLEVEVDPAARVLARFHAPMAGRYVDLTEPRSPAVVSHRFGRGQSLYLPGTFMEMLDTHSLPEHRAILANAVRNLGTPRVGLHAGRAGAHNVEMTVRRQKGRYVVHLVNYAGVMPRPFTAVMPQRDLELEIDPAIHVKSARALAAGRACRISRKGGTQRVRLPVLREYEVVLLTVAG